MKFIRRPFLALALAAMLPTLVSIAAVLYLQLRSEPERVRDEALGRCQTVITLIDAQIRADLAVLNVLAASVYLQTHDWHEFYLRLQRVKAVNPDWITVQLYDVAAGQRLFDLRQPLGAPSPASLDEAQLAQLQSALAPVISGIVPPPEGLVYLYMPVRQAGRLAYVMALGLDPQAYQNILLAYSAPERVSAVVDRDGLFIARNVNYQKRLGTPATTYVRTAISKAPSGWYEGVTYEGVKNFTAYYSSATSGWSAHIAVPYSSVALLSSWSFLVVVLAGIGSAVLGVLLIRVVMLDMEERRSHDEALRQSQKMEAVGQLTGGIAHDFNNLLTPLIGNLDMIRSHAGSDPSLRRMAENALEAARRGAKLSARLMSFSRVQRLQLKPVNLPELLQGMEILLRQSIGPAIQLQIEVDSGAQVVLTDANQLELALLNLAVNSRDAMPDGGLLRITAQRSERQLRQLSKREYVEICVSDNGRGMSDEVRQRAIEPFFTTKPMGQGTGLGLSQVYEIVRESGGLMEIKSDETTGTRIFLYLPLVKPLTDAVESAMSNDTSIARHGAQGGVSVLVVDDDVEVGRFMQAALVSWNYSVTTVIDSDVALKLLERQHFDVMIVDFAMSKMNGAQVARAALERQPEVRILLVSGHSDSAVIEAELGEVRLLQKPFDLQQLKTTVEAVLNEA